MIDDFGLTQAQLSKSVSKSRPQIANTLRLLNLPATVQKKVASGLLSAGHARALLGLPTEADMEQLATRIISEGLSVRSTEEIVSMKVAESDQPKKAKTNKLNPWAGTPMQVGLEKRFGTKVSIKGSKEHGRIEIVFKYRRRHEAHCRPAHAHCRKIVFLKFFGVRGRGGIFCSRHTQGRLAKLTVVTEYRPFRSFSSFCRV